jgi:hypothetical protein
MGAFLELKAFLSRLIFKKNEIRALIFASVLADAIMMVQ